MLLSTSRHPEGHKIKAVDITIGQALQISALFVLSVCSGLMHESQARDVEQVYLRCAEGSLEWLYPTGAVIVNLRPNLPSAEGPLRACVKPRPDSRGARLYVERAGALRLLLTEQDQAAGRVRCFSLQEGVLFVEASARRDISRRITAFQYQLTSTHTPGDQPQSHTGTLTTHLSPFRLYIHIEPI